MPPLRASLTIRLGRHEIYETSLGANLILHDDGTGFLAIHLGDEEKRTDVCMVGGEPLLAALREIVANAERVIAELRDNGKLKKLGVQE